MTWINEPKDITPYVGFVYRIEHIETGEYYIGQKKFWSSANKRLTRKPTKVERVRLARYKEKKQTDKYKEYKATLKAKYKGKTYRVLGRKESDWRTYNSSGSIKMKKELEEHPERFQKMIIYHAKSKSRLNFEEFREIWNAIVVINDPLCRNRMLNIRLDIDKLREPR